MFGRCVSLKVWVRICRDYTQPPESLFLWFLRTFCVFNNKTRYNIERVPYHSQVFKKCIKRGFPYAQKWRRRRRHTHTLKCNLFYLDKIWRGGGQRPVTPMTIHLNYPLVFRTQHADNFGAFFWKIGLHTYENQQVRS